MKNKQNLNPGCACHIYFEQIYYAWEGYLRKIPVEI